MTQRQLSEMVGCSIRHVGQIENANNIPSLAITVAIANALNVGLDELVYDDLQNRKNFYSQEFASLTDGLEPTDKMMSMKLVKAVVSVVKEFK